MYCFTLDAPLSFLDHHLRCGNSLIGVTVQEVREAVEPVAKMTGKAKVAASASEWKTIESRSEQFTLFGSRFAGLLLATDLMRHVGELSDVTSAQVQESRSEYRKASDALAPFKRILDVYTSQWFSNGDIGARRRRAQSDPLALTFLKSREAEAFINANNDNALKQVFDKLSPQDRPIAETALTAATEKRFFHWELEFPEVFYGPRPGITQAIERLEGAGFDAVIGNPPYDEPSQYYSDTTEHDKAFLSEFESYRRFKNGRINLYRLFIVRGLEQAREKGSLAYIVPMTLLADDFSRPTREFLLYQKALSHIEAFPQKDDPRRRVFLEAKLSTSVVVARNTAEHAELYVRTHPGRFIEGHSPKYKTSAQELSQIFKNHIAIPTISDEEWSILRRAFAKKDWPRLNDVAQIYVGEVFDNAPNKKFLSDEPVGPLVLRGANIDRYLLREEASQGRNRYLREKLFRNQKARTTKLDFLSKERVGLQRGAAVDNWRRLIACPIPSGVYCFDTVLLLVPNVIDKRILLGLLNSDLWEWRFRCTSTTNHVNEYELADLVLPPSLLDENTYEYQQLQSLVESLLSSPESEVRRSDYQTISTKSVDFQIDELVFQMYGLRKDDVEVVQKSLSR